MGIFSGANGAQMVGGTRRRLADYEGEHILKVVSIRASDKREIYFAADLEVVSTTNPSLKAGDVVGFYTERHPKYPDYFFSDIKRFLGSVTNTNPDKVTEDDMAAASADNQPAKGLAVACSVLPGGKVNDKTGKAYGEVAWAIKP